MTVLKRAWIDFFKWFLYVDRWSPILPYLDSDIFLNLNNFQGMYSKPFILSSHKKYSWTSFRLTLLKKENFIKQCQITGVLLWVKILFTNKFRLNRPACASYMQTWLPATWCRIVHHVAFIKKWNMNNKTNICQSGVTAIFALKKKKETLVIFLQTRNFSSIQTQIILVNLLLRAIMTHKPPPTHLQRIFFSFFHLGCNGTDMIIRCVSCKRAR